MYMANTATMTGAGVFGERGTELGAFLARPQKFSYGGMTGYTGDINGQPVSIVPGAGGGQQVRVDLHLNVTGSPDWEVRVVDRAIEGGVLRLNADLQQDTPTSRGIKELSKA